MPEMPIDILTERFGRLVDNSQLDVSDYASLAMDIDTELQQKFLSIPLAEIDAIEIEDNRGQFHAGSGPEHCKADDFENPNWLYNHAMNALALYFRIKSEQERREAKMNLRPEPGVYSAKHPGSRQAFAVIVTADREVIVPMEQGDLCDQSDIYDAFAAKGTPWVMNRVNTTTGRFGA